MNFRLSQIFCSVFSLIIFSSCVSGGQQNSVCFKGQCVDVEVVSTSEGRMRGLQFRPSMDTNSGMLFIFDESAAHAFWMKDTLIPLDMIWMDYTRRVVHIEENVQPCRQDPCASYAPAADALYMLEVNAGYVQAHDIHVDHQASFNVKLNK